MGFRLSSSHRILSVC